MICRHSLALFFLARKDGMLPPASSLRASAPRCNSMLSQHDGERRGKEEGGGRGKLMSTMYSVQPFNFAWYWLFTPFLAYNATMVEGKGTILP